VPTLPFPHVNCLVFTQDPITYNECDVGSGVESLCRTLILTFAGTATNDMAPAVQELCEELRAMLTDYCVLILDWRRVPFCYSGILRVFIDFAMTYPRGCTLVFRAHSRYTWQQTSLRVLAGMFRPSVFLLSVPPDDPLYTVEE
jgi:hypothetical protein